MEFLKGILIALSVLTVSCNPLAPESRVDSSFGACGAYNYADVGVNSWIEFQLCLLAATSAGGPSVPNLTTVDVPNAPTAQQFGSGVLAPNGKIYGIPFASGGTGTDPAYVMVFDPNANSASYISVTNTTQASWSSGVLSPDGKIYAFPGSSNNANSREVLVIDPSNDTATTVAVSVSQSTYSGSVVGGTGRLYAIPNNGQNPGRIMAVHPVGADSSISFISFEKTSGGNQYLSAALAPNGNIYAFPSNGHNQLLVLDTSNLTVSFITLSQNGSWVGTVLTPDGKLVGIPAGGGTTGTVILFDPALGTEEYFNISIPNSTDFLGGVLASSGLIIGIPATQVDPVPVMVIDPVQKSGNVSTTVANSGNEKWRGGIHAMNGKIYGFPTSADSTVQMLVVDPRATRPLRAPALLSTYLNKF